MKKLLILSVFILNCASYNFEYGSSLANFQDQKFKDFKANKPLTKEEETRFKSNLWVKTAEKLAPSNLVIRHYCLIDLFNKYPSHKRKIKNQLYLLGEDLYLEGYSYWLYTKPFLDEYSKEFGEFGLFIRDQDKKFQESAYLGTDGNLYPAPFGDLRHEPLDIFLQAAEPVSDNTEIYPLLIKIFKPDTTEYLVQKCLLGFNTHVPDKVQTVQVLNGTVYVKQPSGTLVPFKWYEGYDKKYGSKEAEFNDTFSPERINSLNVKEIWKEYERIFME